MPRHPDRGEAIARMIAAVRPARRLALARGIADRGDRHLCRRHHGRTRAVLPAGADRVHGRIAGRTWRAKSDRGDQARRVDRSRPPRLQFHRRLRGARSRRRRAAGRYAGSAGEAVRPVARRSQGARSGRWPPPSAWSSNSAARWSARSPRSSRICCNCGSRWEPPMREPGFWHGPPR